MDNQQERLFDLGWLIGVIESEGSFTLCKSCRNKRGYRYTPLITMTNCDETMLDNYKRILSYLDIPFYVYKRRYISGVVKSNRPVIGIITRGYKRVKKMLDIITPFMVSKKEQAEILLDFVNYRLGVHYKTPYGTKEDSAYLKMKESHRIPRDYTPDTQSVKI